MKKKLLVTGGLGFLGSYALERFKAEYQITVIDNLSTNAISPQHSLCEGVRVLTQDILEYDWSRSEKFDLILHFASPVGPVGILKHSGKMARVILDDVYWAIDGALHCNCPLLFISTSEIYGYRDRPELLKESDYKLLIGDFKVRNEYSIAKLLSEIVLCNIAKTCDLKYQIVRPFNISGARQQPQGGFVLPTFVTQALRGKAITVFGDGTQVRAFTHAQDIIEGVYRICHSKEINQIWNVGNPLNKTDINTLAKLVKEYTGTISDIVHVDPKTIHGPLYEEAWDKIPDSDKLIENTAWQPAWKVEEIVRDVIAHYQKTMLVPMVTVEQEINLAESQEQAKIATFRSAEL